MLVMLHDEVEQLLRAIVNYKAKECGLRFMPFKIFYAYVWSHVSSVALSCSSHVHHCRKWSHLHLHNRTFSNGALFASVYLRVFMCKQTSEKCCVFTKKGCHLDRAFLAINSQRKVFSLLKVESCTILDQMEVLAEFFTPSNKTESLQSNLEE